MNRAPQSAERRTADTWYAIEVHSNTTSEGVENWFESSIGAFDTLEAARERLHATMSHFPRRITRKTLITEVVA